MRIAPVRPQRCLIAAWILFILATESAAQVPPQVVLKSPSLRKVFPPAVADQTRPGDGKFVIFTLGRVDEDGLSVGGVWECIPSRPETPVTKRVEFSLALSKPEPLLDLRHADADGEMHPQFVTLVGRAEPGEYNTNLYEINYRSWDLRCIWQGRRLYAFGSMGDSIFCSTSNFHDARSLAQEITESWYDKTEDLRVLDVASGNLSSELPFVPRAKDGKFWLVRKPGETEGVWSYSLAQRKYIAHFGEVAIPRNMGYYQSKLSPDGRNRAWILAPIPKGWMNDWFFGTVDGQLILQRDGKKEDVTAPIKFVASAGTAYPVSPSGIQLTFPAEDKVEFRASAVDLKPEDRVWSIDAVRGHVTESVAPQSEQREDPLFAGIPVPDYLRPQLKEFVSFGASGIAPAFLMHVGILSEPPQYADCAAGVSPDGRHILFRALKGPLARVLIYGDLVTKQTVRWDLPRELDQGHLDFAWVKTPD